MKKILFILLISPIYLISQNTYQIALLKYNGGGIFVGHIRSPRSQNRSDRRELRTNERTNEPRPSSPLNTHAS